MYGVKMSLNSLPSTNLEIVMFTPPFFFGFRLIRTRAVGFATVNPGILPPGFTSPVSLDDWLQ